MTLSPTLRAQPLSMNKGQSAYSWLKHSRARGREGKNTHELVSVLGTFRGDITEPSISSAGEDVAGTALPTRVIHASLPLIMRTLVLPRVPTYLTKHDISKFYSTRCSQLGVAIRLSCG